MRVKLTQPVVDNATHLLAAAVIMTLSLMQRVGEITFDTKFDLTHDPSAFLARAMHLWNPTSNFGELQNQAYGYLFPQGSFFVLGEALGLPVWSVQRLWSGLLLVAAYEGARRVWRAISGDGSQLGGLAVGLAYAFSPRLLGLDGVLTGEILPTVVLPWMMLPLALARSGRLTRRTSALLSAAVFLLCGGVNAVENLAILPLPALVLLFGLREPGARRQLGWWCAGIAAASWWWMVPLLVLGRYSPPFLDYIETAAATTGPLGWANVTRGADHWVGFVTIGDQALWPASYFLSATTGGIIITSLVAALSLAGLFREGMPWARPLLAALVTGLACLTVAHAGAWSSPLADGMRDLLNGLLAPLRNVHKVDPLVRLPLALGLGHLVHEIRRLDLTPSRRPIATLGLLVIVSVVAAGGVPLVLGQMRMPGWTAVPDSWLQAARYLDAQQSGGRVLVLPGSGVADHLWGRTVDEPIQALSSVAWVSRSQVPLVPGPTIRMLDTIEERITDGTGSPVLGQFLARAGIEFVVVRRDLTPGSTDSPPPNRVDMAIGRSGGLRHEASFGTTPIGGLPVLDIYRVEEPVRRVDAVPLASVPVVSGSPGDILSGLEYLLLEPDQPVLFRADNDVPPLYWQADGYRLVQRQFGRVHDATTGTMSPGDPVRGGVPARDYMGVTGERPSFLQHAGIAGMEASSSAGFADNLGSASHGFSPYSAVDGNLRTRWETSAYSDPGEAWLKLRFRHSRPLRLATIRFAKGPGMARVRYVSVTTDRQTLEVPVDPQSGLAVVDLDGRSTTYFQVAVSRVMAGEPGASVGIREIWIPGMPTDQKVVLPDVGAGGTTSFIFGSRPPRAACTPTLGGPVCDISTRRAGEGESSLARSVTLASGGDYRIRGEAAPGAFEAVQALTEPLDSNQVTVRSASTYGNDPLVVPQAAYDGSLSTAWLSEPWAESPKLTLTWGTQRTLTRLRLAAPANAERPAVAILRTRTEERTVVLDGDYSDGSFKPLRTKRVTIEFRRPRVSLENVPLGVAELEIDGLDALRYDPEADAPTGSVCGLGPEVRVDGRLIQTQVAGTLAELRTSSSLGFESCGGSPVRLSAGTHTVEIDPTGQFVPVSAVLDSIARPRFVQVKRDVAVESWHTNDRVVSIAPGPEAVLRIPENANRGWLASLDGRPLRSVTPDGWQQGFVVPEGQGGLVTLQFRPNRTYRLSLVLGAVLAALLCLGAGASAWSDRRAGRRARGRITLDMVERGATKRRRSVRAARFWPWVALAASGLLGGVAVLGGFVLARVVGRASVLVGSLLVGLAGVAQALSQGHSMPRSAADLIAGCGVGLLVASVVWVRSESRGSGG